MAFVEAMAGIMFFTTPWVNDHVTPSILNSFARANAVLYSQLMCSGSSVSIFLSDDITRHKEFKVKLSRHTTMYTRPLENRCPLYAMLGQPGGVRDGTDGERSWLVEHVEGTFVARCHGWKDNTSLSFETCESIQST